MSHIVNGLVKEETQFRNDSELMSYPLSKIKSDFLYIASVYLSVFPSEKGEETVKNINTNVKEIRFDLGQRVRHQLRIIPELRFFLDKTIDYMAHIDELLKK